MYRAEGISTRAGGGANLAGRPSFSTLSADHGKRRGQTPAWQPRNAARLITLDGSAAELWRAVNANAVRLDDHEHRISELEGAKRR